MPEIGFEYNNEEYRFELTWKSYYLNIKPFAIYNEQYYDLKQIIPWLKNTYPNIDYRTAVQKFRNYHRWGYWLEKLPQDIADNLDYLGFELDYNIPLSVVEIEEVEGENFTFKRIHIANKLTLDFYDLYERGFSVEINKTTILIGNVKGKTDIDLDPITYSSPIITVTGFTVGAPCTFKDLWDQDQTSGWNIVHNNENNDTQFQIDARLVIGDGTNATWFADTKKQVTFPDGIITANGQDLIDIEVNANFTLGTLVSLSEKAVEDGCSIINRESSYYLWMSNLGVANLYATQIFGNGWGGRILIEGFNRIWGVQFIDGPSLRGVFNAFDVNILGGYISSPSSTSTADDLYVISYADHEGLYIANDGVITNSKFYITGTYLASMNNVKVFNFTNCETNKWTFNFASAGTFYRKYTLNVVVVDKDGNPVENADVTLTYQGQGGGTEYSGTTPANGSIPEQTISKGFYNQTGGDTIYPYEPYNLTIEAPGYLTQTFIFNVSTPIDWEVPLIETEDGLVIENNFPLAFFGFIMIACASLYIGWTRKPPTESLWAYFFSLLFWIATMYQWNIDNGTSNPAFMYLFFFPIIALVFFIYEEATKYYEESMQGYKQDPFG